MAEKERRHGQIWRAGAPVPEQERLLPCGAGQLPGQSAGTGGSYGAGFLRGLLPDLSDGSLAVCPAGLLHSQADVKKVPAGLLERLGLFMSSTYCLSGRTANILCETRTV